MFRISVTVLRKLLRRWLVRTALTCAVVLMRVQSQKERLMQVAQKALRLLLYYLLFLYHRCC